MNYIVITSINKITEAVKAYANLNDWHTIVVGDTKSQEYTENNITFLNIDTQKNLDFNSVKTTPINHYSRKNIGYLYAMKMNAELIYDTDDDTLPYENWSIRKFSCRKVVDGEVNLNPYSMFTEKKVWPRGFNLSYINKKQNIFYKEHNRNIGVWQGVIDGDSDFDAVYRLVNNEHIIYNKAEDVCLEKMCFAPFNTQSTLWNKKFNLLMYIPITVDFRFTDILRGYIAQRIMWDYNHYLGFHYPNTYQIRNPHDYFIDFIGEMNMYKHVPQVINLLSSINLKNIDIASDLLEIYKKLVIYNIVKKDEIINLKNWIKDFNKIN